MAFYVFVVLRIFLCWLWMLDALVQRNHMPFVAAAFLVGSLLVLIWTTLDIRDAVNDL